jgi:hypothetical protein
VGKEIEPLKHDPDALSLFRYFTGVHLVDFGTVLPVPDELTVNDNASAINRFEMIDAAKKC